MRVFARRGIGSARHAEVAQEAGVSVPTAFVYFPTRADLVDAVLGEVSRLVVGITDAVHAVEGPAPARILAHAEAFADAVDAHPDHARVLLNWSSAVREDVWPTYLEIEERIVRTIAATLERGQREGSIAGDVPPEDGARIAVGAGLMIAQMKLSGRPAPQVARFVDSLVRTLAGGLAPTQPVSSGA